MAGKHEAGGPSDLEEETEEILFLHMACRSMDPAAADRALRELWRRHRDHLRRSCQQLCRRFKFDSACADDLAAATWAKVIDRAEQYRVGDDVTHDAQVRRTRAWMNKIAQNLLIDWWRNPQRANRVDERELDRGVEDYSSFEFAQMCAEQFQATGSAARLNLIAQAFDEVLNEDERLILLATVVHRTHSPAGTYMERGSARALALKLNTTTATLRKRRERAFRKIAAFVNVRAAARKT